MSSDALTKSPAEGASWRSFAAWAGFAFAVLVLDQTVKIWFQRHFYVGEFLEVTPFFNLCHVRNTGAAFSFLSEAGGWQTAFFAGLAAVVGVACLMAMKRSGRAVLQCAAALILSGAAGNAIDRVVLGSVVDFLDFHLNVWHWPAFNVADIAICCGAALLFLAEWLRSSDSAQKGAP